jgi:chromosome partitioning protein
VLNSLTAADTVLIPVQCEFFALEGLALLITTIQRVQKSTNSALDLEGFLLTMYQKNNHSMTVAEDVRSHFEKMTFETVINRNVYLSEAASQGKPAMLHDARSSGAINYMELAKEFLKRNTAQSNK